MINLLCSIYRHQVSPFDIVVRAVGDATPLHFMFFFWFSLLEHEFHLKLWNKLVFEKCYNL